MSPAQEPGRTPSLERWLEVLSDPRTGLEFPRFSYGSVSAPFSTGARVLDTHLLWYVVRGRIHGSINGDEATLTAGTCLWLSPGVEHDFVVPTDVVQFAIRFGLRRRVRPRIPLDSILCPEAHALRPALEQLHQEHRNHWAYREGRMRHLLASALILLLRRSRSPADGRALREQQRMRLTALFERTVRDGLSPADMARELGLTPDYFSRVFKRTYVMSPRRWLIGERVRFAERLLGDVGLSIKEVAHAAGYRDANLFGRQFSALYGMSPRAYRRR